jgi:hypothetical protein
MCSITAQLATSKEGGPSPSACVVLSSFTLPSLCAKGPLALSFFVPIVTTCTLTYPFTVED